ncbi:uncharacterized protein BT62DRAFT_1075321 [Guyanagaster necrorhizus]|uniref:Uncharacterized protein n=1 Tax=Guyanagaster necrorhizus TaxID=856835 RepID=A0A9P7VW41_9AGAR|nr:uncharacterized protein BT62DRAFT_1075321 [Guyanagaster necrorhizus MCA 3950]KAG7447239.1 hypothetical protein BT62DRAFT_1075321 [Guyanagaster necrorhizus MCA 3950]
MAASRVASRQLSQHLSTIATKWVQDPFRHIQLSVFLESLAKHPRLTPQAVEAASALQNNIVFNKYPLSPKTLEPASVPLHYSRLVEGMEKSAQGIGRPWWKAFFGVW